MVTHNAAAEQALNEKLDRIPLPAGATTDGWLSIRAEDGEAIRTLEWSRHDAPGVAGVGVCGWQDEDGAINRFVNVVLDWDELTAEGARSLAAKLVEAAAALDALA